MSKNTIYSTATCGYCKMLKSYLQSKDITFEEKHVDKDHKLAEEVFEKSGQLGVPFTIIEKDDGTEEKILGFDKSKVDLALGLS